MKKKILIIGGGISGIYVGYLLKKEGFSIKILEANDRIGGRIYTKKVHNTKVELGAACYLDRNYERPKSPPMVYNLRLSCSHNRPKKRSP